MMKTIAEIKTKLRWGGCFLWLILSWGCSWHENKVRVEEIKANDRSIPARKIVYQDFRQASENLDFAALATQNLDANQRALVSGLQQVLGGNISSAETLFRELATSAPAGWIKNYAAEVFINLLYFQSKWKDLQTVLAPPAAQKEASDRQNFPFKELGRANSENYCFPEQPLILPLELSPSGTPVITVMINGQKEKFWLDSGAAFSVLSSETARQMNILPINQNRVSAATLTDKKIMVQMAVIESMKIGSLEITNHPAMIMRLQDLFFKIPGLFKGWMGRRINNRFEVNGILGMNAIRNLNIHLDFLNKRIVIFKPENKQPDERNFFWLGYPIVICRSLDGVPLYFGLDTGAKKSILASAILSKLSPVSAYRTRMKVWGAGGDVKIIAQVLPRLDIQVDGYQVSFKDINAMPLNQFGLVRLDGILGMDFTAGCSSLKIDLQNGALILHHDRYQPGKAMAELPEGKNQQKD